MSSVHLQCSFISVLRNSTNCTDSLTHFAEDCKIWMVEILQENSPVSTPTSQTKHRKLVLSIMKCWMVFWIVYTNKNIISLLSLNGITSKCILIHSYINKLALKYILCSHHPCLHIQLAWNIRHTDKCLSLQYGYANMDKHNG